MARLFGDLRESFLDSGKNLIFNFRTWTSVLYNSSRVDKGYKQCRTEPGLLLMPPASLRDRPYNLHNIFSSP